MNQSPTLKPMPLWAAFLMFAIPSALTTIGLYVVLPIIAERISSPVLWWFLLFYAGPLALMVPAAFIAYRLEGNPPTWQAFKERMNLKPLKGRDWLWILALIVFGLVTQILLKPTSVWLASLPFFKPPPFVPPAVDPNLTALPTEIMGVMLVGNWLPVIVYFVALIFNIVGEEFWMRGIMLPRQILTHGKWAWLVHGLMWTLFHFFQRWIYIMILPVALFQSYIVQRTKNTTIAIVAHFIANGVLGLIPIVIVVLGG